MAGQNLESALEFYNESIVFEMNLTTLEGMYLTSTENAFIKKFLKTQQGKSEEFESCDRPIVIWWMTLEKR